MWGKNFQTRHIEFIDALKFGVWLRIYMDQGTVEEKVWVFWKFAKNGRLTLRKLLKMFNIMNFYKYKQCSSDDIEKVNLEIYWSDQVRSTRQKYTLGLNLTLTH